MKRLWLAGVVLAAASSATAQAAETYLRVSGGVLSLPDKDVAAEGEAEFVLSTCPIRPQDSGRCVTSEPFSIFRDVNGEGEIGFADARSFRLLAGRAVAADVAVEVELRRDAIEIEADPVIFDPGTLIVPGYFLFGPDGPEDLIDDVPPAAFGRNASLDTVDGETIDSSFAFLNLAYDPNPDEARVAPFAAIGLGIAHHEGLGEEVTAIAAQARVGARLVLGRFDVGADLTAVTAGDFRVGGGEATIYSVPAGIDTTVARYRTSLSDADISMDRIGVSVFTGVRF